MHGEWMILLLFLCLVLSFHSPTKQSLEPQQRGRERKSLQVLKGGQNQAPEDARPDVAIPPAWQPELPRGRNLDSLALGTQVGTALSDAGAGVPRAPRSPRFTDEVPRTGSSGLKTTTAA